MQFLLNTMQPVLMICIKSSIFYKPVETSCSFFKKSNLNHLPTTSSQDILFQRIKEILPQHISLVDAISEVLHVSSDSAYRRIRGETPLVLEEAKTLCHQYNLSLDQLLEAKKGVILFRDYRLNNHQYDYRQYLQGLNEQLEAVNNFMQKEIIYMSKDLPIFHNFYYRPLIAFRYYFWMKTHLMHPDFEKKQFHFDLLPTDIEQMSFDLTKTYSRIPSTEMWNTESINSTISQIEFSKDSGHFQSSADIKIIYEALEETIYHMQQQAEYGCKFTPGEDPQGRKSNFKFFFNRVVLGDNTIMVITDFVKAAFINYGHLNYITTSDESFCKELYSDFENLIRRSTQISQSSEKQRNIFFNIILSKIGDRKRNL